VAHDGDRERQMLAEIEVAAELAFHERERPRDSGARLLISSTECGDSNCNQSTPVLSRQALSRTIVSSSVPATASRITLDPGAGSNQIRSRIPGAAARRFEPAGR